MKKIAYLHRRIPHYRIPFFKALIENNKNKIVINILASPLEFLGGSGLPVDYKDLPNIMLFKKVRLPFFKNFFFQKKVISNILKHNYDLLVVEGTVHYLSSWLILGIRKLKGKSNVIWLKGWPFDKKSKGRKVIKRWFLSLADNYIVYGKASVDLLKKYGIPEDKITIAQNTVDYNKIINTIDYCINREERFEFIQKKFVFYFGRLVEKKKVENLIDAYKQLRNKFNEIILVIAGEGPCRNFLSDYTRSKKIEGVCFLGSVSDEELAILLSNALCCVFPGAVGLSINIAMAAGKLVITADEVGPDSELIIHNETGIRFNKGDVEELTNILMQVIDNKELLKIGINARKFIITNASISNMVEKHSKVLTEVN